MPSESAGSATVPTPKAVRQPGVDVGPERRHVGQPSERPVKASAGDRLVSAPQVRRLHRAGAATGGDDVGRAEGAAEPGRGGVPLAPADQSVAAHHAHESTVLHPGLEGLVDRVVVQGPGERCLAVDGLLRPGVDAGVEGVGVAGRVVELASGVEGVTVGRRPGQPAAAGARSRRAPRGRRGRRARSRRRGPRRRRSRASADSWAAQVQPVQPPAAQRCRAGAETAVEVGHRRDLDRPPAGPPHAADATAIPR